VLFLFIAALSLPSRAIAQQPGTEEPGVTGYVLTPDGTPASGGNGRHSVGHDVGNGVNRQHWPIPRGPVAIEIPASPGERTWPGAVPRQRDNACFEIAAAATRLPRHRCVFSRAAV